MCISCWHSHRSLTSMNSLPSKPVKDSCTTFFSSSPTLSSLLSNNLPQFEFRRIPEAMVTEFIKKLNSKSALRRDFLKTAT